MKTSIFSPFDGVFGKCFGLPCFSTKNQQPHAGQIAACDTSGVSLVGNHTSGVIKSVTEKSSTAAEEKKKKVAGIDDKAVEKKVSHTMSYHYFPRFPGHSVL